MPIYEYLCEDCNRIFNFLVRSTASAKAPACPKCGKPGLRKLMSRFAAPRRRAAEPAAAAAADGPEAPLREEGPPGGPDFDDPRVEREMTRLMSQMESMDESDPRAVAHFMRKLTEISGERIGPGMQEAIRRMEAGEDPEKVEEDLGDELAEETGGMFGGEAAEDGPTYDEGLYDM
ncbi:MAG: zinc ribbon domain-containing protein [Planctomycetes bacterium]|nr:zinc ribbon domain-containing protein [Planctomycetota bacterium]